MATKQSLTTKQLLALFGVSSMTINSWGKGTTTRDALPSNKDESGKRTFPLGKTKQWAKRYDITMLVDPESLMKDVTASKPGPKAKVAEKKPLQVAALLNPVTKRAR